MDTQDTLKLRPLIVACLVATLFALVVTLGTGIWLAQKFSAIDFQAAADRIKEAQPADKAGHPVRAWLVVLRGQKPGMKYPLYEGKNYLGRAGDQPVDVNLAWQEAADQAQASSPHAIITVTGEAIVLEDAKSDNGTFVNRDKVTPDKKVTLKKDDVIQIGAVQLEVMTK
ncbi:MAG: FHA domain-containing protein [Gemmataceae bacterium]